MSKITEQQIPLKITGSKLSAAEFEILRKSINSAQIEIFDPNYTYSKDEATYVEDSKGYRKIYQSVANNNIGNNPTANGGLKLESSIGEAQIMPETVQADGIPYWDTNSLIAYDSLLSGSTRQNNTVNIANGAGIPTGILPTTIDPDYATKLYDPVEIIFKENGVTKLTLKATNLFVLYILIGQKSFYYLASDNTKYSVIPAYGVDQSYDISEVGAVKWKLIPDSEANYYTKEDQRNFGFLQRLTGPGPQINLGQGTPPMTENTNYFHINLRTNNVGWGGTTNDVPIREITMNVSIFCVGRGSSQTYNNLYIKFDLRKLKNGINQVYPYPTGVAVVIHPDFITVDNSEQYQANHEGFTNPSPFEIFPEVLDLLVFELYRPNIDGMDNIYLRVRVKEVLPIFTGLNFNNIEITHNFGYSYFNNEIRLPKFSDFYAKLITENTDEVYDLGYARQFGIYQKGENLFQGLSRKRFLTEADLSIESKFFGSFDLELVTGTLEYTLDLSTIFTDYPVGIPEYFQTQINGLGVNDYKISFPSNTSMMIEFATVTNTTNYKMYVDFRNFIDA